MLHDKPALHQEYRRVFKRMPKGETDRELILSILNLEYPRSEAPPRNKTRANPAGTR
jgi:hypothetical protein